MAALFSHFESFFLQLVSSCETTLGSYQFIFGATFIALILKSYIIFLLFRYPSQAATARSRFYLVIVLICSLIEDSVWLFLASQKWAFPPAHHTAFTPYVLFLIRISWAFAIIFYQSLSLFLESLLEQELLLTLRQKIFLFISSCFVLTFAIYPLTIFYEAKLPPFGNRLQEAGTLYALFLLFGSTLFVTSKKLQSIKLPRLLKKQARLIKIVLIPRLLTDLIQYYPFNFSPGLLTNNYPIIGVSTLLLTAILFYCLRKIAGLRFLNFRSHVQASTKYNFIDDFKDVLEQLSKTTSVKELGHISQTFFREAFSIPIGRTTLYIRPVSTTNAHGSKIELARVETLTETFLSNDSPELWQCINKVKILIYDEIDFNNFYSKNYADTAVLHFLDSIHADIFLPIYKNSTIIAYLIVDRYARINEFYSHLDRDEMLVFASYLSNIINLLQNRNLDTLIHQEKELKEELYKKHQEINQYKESIRSFLKHQRSKEIGIIFYKQRRFTYGNQTARELVPINLNTQEGHPVSKSFRQLARQVEEYKSPQSCFIKDAQGARLVLAGVPSIEHNSVIITVCYPDVSDIITKQLNLLKDPTKWDYLLYLETTKPGQLINQLIPSSSETLLNFKIALLQTSLSKKAILLEMPEQDLMPTVELLHHISMREHLQVLKVQGQPKNFELAIALFGINPIFGINQQTKPLLEKLDGTGTLFIQNIHFLDIETQEHLAEYLKYGYYRIFKSDQKVMSNVRIICSTNQHLPTMVQEGSFLPALFDELKKTSLQLPSLLTLSENELYELAQGFSEQAIKTEDFKSLLELTQKDKTRLAQYRPVSLQELKLKVQQLLEIKSKKSNINQEIEFDPAYVTSDPELIQAARLGKHALRDQKTMVMLWNKFKNQNKIAAFLGVNRSSVNRRCRAYNLE